MSADNGVYILVTPSEGGSQEFRVAHLQAVENVEYGRCPIHGSDIHLGNSDKEPCDYCKANSDYSTDASIHIQNAREMWRSAEIHTTEAEAFTEAASILRSLAVCEYGISFIEIP